MEIKFKYQYTYFIYPYIIEQKDYKNYLASLLNNEKFSFKIFEKEKNLEIFSNFLPNIKNTMFETFSYNAKKARNFNNLNSKEKLKELNNMECINFEYKLDKDIQGKILEKEERNIF